MAYRCPFFSVNPYEYRNVYSTPEVEFMGTPVGTVDREDCARRIQDTMVSYNFSAEVKRTTLAGLRICRAVYMRRRVYRHSLCSGCWGRGRTRCVITASLCTSHNKTRYVSHASAYI